MAGDYEVASNGAGSGDGVLGGRSGERDGHPARRATRMQLGVAGGEVAGDDVAGDDDATGAGTLPAPRPHRMGNQRRITHRVYGFHVENPGAQARGNNRYIRCVCGWLVQVNATGKAHARVHPRPPRSNHRAGEVGRHEAATACTNYKCTGRADHYRERRRHLDRQSERRRAIIAGEAMLIYLTDDHPIPTAPPPGCRLALRWARDHEFA